MAWLDVTAPAHWTRRRWVATCAPEPNCQTTSLSPGVADDANAYTFAGGRWHAPTLDAGAGGASSCFYDTSNAPTLSYLGATAGLTGVRITVEIAEAIEIEAFMAFLVRRVTAFDPTGNGLLPKFALVHHAVAAGIYPPGYPFVVTLSADDHDLPTVLDNVTGLFWLRDFDMCGPCALAILDIVSIEVEGAAVPAFWTDHVGTEERS